MPGIGLSGFYAFDDTGATSVFLHGLRAVAAQLEPAPNVYAYSPTGG
jgi:hypothetical protein